MTKPKRPTARHGSGCAPAGYVSDVDYFLTLLAERNVRFDSEIAAMVTDLNAVRENTVKTIDLLTASMERQFTEMDRRYGQRFSLEKSIMMEALASSQTAIKVALEASDKAMTKAETATEKRFDSVNEFRAQLKDQAATFFPRIEAEQRFTELGERIQELRNSDALRTGRSAGSNSLYGWIIGAIGALTTIVVVATTLLR